MLDIDINEFKLKINDFTDYNQVKDFEIIEIIEIKEFWYNI